MEHKEYNGWTNYETWCCSRRIDNDEGSYEFWNAQALEAWDDSEAGGHYSSQTRVQNAESILADRMKHAFEESAPTNGQASFYADLMGAALAEVNWHEIARHRLDALELAEPEESDEEETATS